MEREASSFSQMNSNHQTESAEKKREPVHMDFIKENEWVQRFLDRVMVQIYTEEEAEDIKVELLDHIYSLAQDYQEAGYGTDAAVHKALLQMGDPSEIGYSFTDYDAIKIRHWKRLGLKGLSIAIMVIVFIWVIMIGVNTTATESQLKEESVSQSLTQEEDQGSLAIDTSQRVNQTEVSGALLQSIVKVFIALYEALKSNLFLVVYFLYFPLLFNATYNQRRLQGIPLSKLDVNEDPLMILWDYKRTFPWEYLILTVIFTPLVITFFFIAATDGANILIGIGIVAILIFALWLFVTSEKFRIPKYVVLEDGLLVKSRLLTWTSIDKVSWISDHRSKDRSHYMLVLEFQTSVQNNRSRHNQKNNFWTSHNAITFKKQIRVNANQVTQLRKILKERV